MINGSQLRDAIVSAAYTIANQKQKVDVAPTKLTKKFWDISMVPRWFLSLTINKPPSMRKCGFSPGKGRFIRTDPGFWTKGILIHILPESPLFVKEKRQKSPCGIGSGIPA